MKKILLAAAGVALAATTLTACGDKYNEPYRDAPRNGTDGGAAMVVEMPDGFSNLATKCLKGTQVRVTVVYHGDNHYGTVSQVIDPTCNN